MPRNMNSEFDIGLSYQNDIPQEFIDQFVSNISQQGLKVESRSREVGVYAAFEWAIPTLVIAYIAKPFLEGFLTEAGKDSYLTLKAGLLGLFDQLFGKNTGERAKVRSLLFSIRFKDHHGRSIKCVFPEGLSLDGYAIILDDLYDLLFDDQKNHQSGTLNKIMSEVEGMGGSYYIEYSIELKKWIAIDTNREAQIKATEQKE